MKEQEIAKLIGRSWIRLRILIEIAKFSELTVGELYRLLGKERKRYQYLMKHLKCLQELGFIKIEDHKIRITPKGEKYSKKIIALLEDCTNASLDHEPLKVYLAGHYKAWSSLKLLLQFIKDFKYIIPQPLSKYVDGFPLLVSIGVYWNGRFNIPKDLMERDYISELFVDSGAQQFFNKFKGSYYPYTPRDYIKTCLNILKADLIATLDLPLDLLVPRGIISVNNGIRKTVDYGINCIDIFEKEIMEGNRNSIIVPVLQGFNDPSQWLECYDIYKEHGIDKNRFRIWGIGSLCIARSYKFASRIIQEIRSHLGWDVKLHVFGLGLHIVRKIYQMIDSYDTSAWVYWAKMDGAFFTFFPRRIKDSWKPRFMQWVSRINHKYNTVEIMALNALNILLHNEVLAYMKKSNVICKNKV